jgi:hypothetical protein
MRLWRVRSFLLNSIHVFRALIPGFCFAIALAALCHPIGAQSSTSEEKENSRRFLAWPETGFKRAETRMVEPFEIYPEGAPGYRDRLALTLVYLEGTSWTQARVLRHVRKTARILSPCAIELDRVRLVKAEVSKDLRRIDTSDVVAASDIPRDVQQLSSMLPASADWPALFFVDRFVVEEDALARSYQQGEVPFEEIKKYPYMNTAWISYKTHWIERAEDGYSTVAHELAHLLCRCGHEDGSERHLLHEFRNFLGTRVLPQHCNQFLQSPIVRHIDLSQRNK